MAGNTSQPVETVLGAVRERTREAESGLGVGRYLSTLTVADRLSLTALFFAWVAALLILDGAPNWGVVVMFLAFLFDKADGFYAREYGEPSPFGRRVDSFIDIFSYLVPAALLSHVAIAPNIAASAVVGFVVICLGGLRLLRHDAEGFESADGTSYYRGTTVVHTNVVVVLNYLLATLVAVWSWPLATVLILLASPLMISEYRAPKTVRAHVILGAFAAIVAGVCLLLATGLA